MNTTQTELAGKCQQAQSLGLSGWSQEDLLRLASAQEGNAVLYRKYARISPWNSKTRKGWVELAETAEKLANAARSLIAS